MARKTYIPTAAALLFIAARFLHKYRNQILTAVKQQQPGSLTAVTAAIDSVLAAATTIEYVHALIDPAAYQGGYPPTFFE